MSKDSSTKYDQKKKEGPQKTFRKDIKIILKKKEKK